MRGEEREREKDNMMCFFREDKQMTHVKIFLKANKGKRPQGKTVGHFLNLENFLKNPGLGGLEKES